MHRSLLLTTTCACLIGFSAAALAAGLTCKLTPGFDLMGRSRTWLPVCVEISNPGAAATGRITIPVHSSGETEVIVPYVADIQLPSQSKKRLFLYVPYTRLEPPVLTIDRTRVPLSDDLSRLRPVANEERFVVVVGGDPGILNSLRGVDSSEELPPGATTAALPQGAPEGYQVAYVGWEELPDSWLGWDGVDAVVIADTGSAAASAPALQALTQWVRLGGTIVLPGGALAPALVSGPLRDLLPMNVTGTRTLGDLGAVATWLGQQLPRQPVLAAQGAAHPAATVLCEAEGQPLVAVRRSGGGRAIMTAFDYSAEPVRHWDGQVVLWRLLLSGAGDSRMLPRMPGAENGPPGTGSESSLLYRLAGMEETRLPPVWLILGFLIAYIIVLVPVNHWVLKRRGRLELAWVTSPLIVAVFTLGAYGLGYNMRGGSIILRRVGVIEARAGGGPGLARGYFSLFSPSRRTYEVSTMGTAAGARNLLDVSHGSGRPATIVCSPDPRVSDISMRMWTSRAFAVEFAADLGNGVQGVAHYDGKVLRARITNATGLPLRHCRLMIGQSVGPEHDLTPGQAADFDVTPGQRPGMGGPGGPPQAFASAPFGPPGSKRSEASETAELLQQALGLLTWGAHPGSLASGDGTRPLRPCLIASCDRPLVPVRIAQPSAITRDANLIVVRMPLRLVGGKTVVVAPGLIARRVVARREAGRRRVPSGPQSPTTTTGSGAVTYEFLVPTGSEGVKAAALTLRRFSSSGPPGAPGGPPGAAPPPVMKGGYSVAAGVPTPAQWLKLEFSAYNFALAQWDGLPARPTISLPHAWDYMSPDGRVLVRIAVPASQDVLPAVSLEAEVKAR